MTGGGAPEVSVLETPVLMLAGVMAFFLVVTGGFEWVSFNFFFFLLPRLAMPPPSTARPASFFFFFNLDLFFLLFLSPPLASFFVLS